ncbi:hypothetical protein HL658_12890 [Azospirillum sp. RWY-5-1]|uniref:SGNH/GDSL hydrolase family protein n=1 Tax=Azospirillum oleiclasticum TaxID=2735135 RepID=A0ABX2T8I1_9PROT|nr:hypothetical protein [Azospirillum oleiclasticum]NYZ13449.1 hypothetical protein [Azospirillum oleiclasticum]NYZ20610.1 hypothetical protein [Azospirillum oleiclasticum]
MKVGLSALVLAAAVATAVPRAAMADAPAEPCAVPDTVMAVGADLPRVRDRMARGAPLSILILNTAKPVADRVEAPYPARLEGELNRRLAGRRAEVTIRNLPNATAATMLPALSAAITEKRPALVIWQTGTVDAMRRIDTEAFDDALTDGIALAHKSGTDIILMGMQYSLQTTQLIDFEPYVENMGWVAQNTGVLHFPRYAIMRYWVDENMVDFTTETPEARRRAYAFVHGCIARLLAGSITAMIGNVTAKAP